MDMSDIGRVLIIGGVILLVFGGLLLLGSRIPGFGQLPGDVVIRRDGLTVYFPIVTMIVVSIILTIAINVANRFFR